MTEIWDDDGGDDTDVKGNSLLVALALADFANPEGLCWPHVGTLARRTRMTERSIHRILKQLDEEGIVLVPPGERSEKNPFVVGRQNVTRHQRQVGPDIRDSADLTPASGPHVEPPELNHQGTTKSLPNGSARPTATQLQREAVQRVWDYWIEISGKRQRLDAKRERMIKNALTTLREIRDCDLEEAERLVKLALLGLWRNPHHQGNNEQRKQYLEIMYALRGKGDESDDTRIDKAIQWAAIYAPDLPSMPEPKVARLLDEIRYTMSLEHKPERARAERAYRELRRAGFSIKPLTKPPWAMLER